MKPTSPLQISTDPLTTRLRCPECKSVLHTDEERFECPSCTRVMGRKRENFLDFMLQVALEEDYQTFYEEEGTEADDLGGPRISAQRFKLPNILRVLPDGFTPDRLLDMGCGGGWILEGLIPRLGPEHAWGLDISETRLTEASRRCPGARLLRAPVESVPLPADSVELITCLDVIEHVPDPDRLLREAHRLARHLVIKFPIEDTLFDRVQKDFWWPLKREVKAWWTGRDTSEPFEPHLHRFQYESARRLLRRHGYRIVTEHVSDLPWEDNHATLFPPAYNITDRTPPVEKALFHLKRFLLVHSMRATHLLLRSWYHRIFNTGFYLYCRREDEAGSLRS